MATAATFLVKELRGERSAEAGLSASTTRCARCEGLMVIEPCFDSTGDASHLDCLTRRCVQCGEVIDPVILQNRRRQIGNVVGPAQEESKLEVGTP